MRTIIIEDNVKQLNDLIEIIKSILPEIEIIDTANSVATAQLSILKHQPELVLSDVMLGEHQSFEVFKDFNEINFEIIFTTGHDEFALTALRMNALDYILKPINPVELKNAISKFKEKDSAKKKIANLEDLISNFSSGKLTKLTISNHASYDVIDLDNIVRLESDKNYTEFILKDGKKIVSSKSIKEYDEILESQGFFRIHKSHIVNLSCIKQLLKAAIPQVKLNNGDLIDVARRRKDDLIALISSIVSSMKITKAYLLF